MSGKSTDMKNNADIGAVLVVGGGVGGIQTSLDLAESGYKVYLVEDKPVIGGVMAQLDKTFPTNDCSLCILSPKLVEVSRHPNIEIITYADIKDIKGIRGDFTATITKKARYVTSDCVGCGLCSEACVLSGKIDNEFDEQLKKRSAIYIPYPQAVPLQYVVDPKECLYISRGKCSQKCLDACDANAINFNDKDKDETINIGSIIFAPGYDVFPAHVKSEYGYGRFKNVLTSIEFERVLSASGPFEGHVCRPSDNKEPQKIAWINCVGSRDNACGNNYCSSVCCTYAIKEALIAKEHVSDLQSTIFYMDMRTFGKGFERYYNRAKDEQGITFIRSRVAHIYEDNTNQNLFIRYEDENGILHDEEFEMIVLSVGLIPPKGAQQLAEKTGLTLNEFGFYTSNELTPLETEKEGIYVCGAFSGPKDIPETVIEASGAAIKASNVLSAVRNTLIEKKSYPVERDVVGEKPRIGVFICHCGINIAGYVNIKTLVNFTKTLPNVAYAEENIYSCSQDTQKKIVETIKEHKLNRVIVASCTPRTHEPLFQETIREAGLNPYLFEMANIRDQCSWVHMADRTNATDKAKDQIKMIVAKANKLQPLSTIKVEINKEVLVIGGGIAGLTSALMIADQGYEVFLVEKEKELGGNAKKIHWTLEEDDVQKYLKNLVNAVSKHPKIHVFTHAMIESIDGYIGNYKTMICNGVGSLEIEHGVVVVATGAEESVPEEYLYGKDTRVLTQLELECRLAEDMDFSGKTVVMIQCVGSREDHRPYCSRVCCTDAIKNAIKIKEHYPDSQVFVLYRDMRTYGFKEIYYEKAREMGVIFIRYDKEKKPVVQIGSSDVEVSVSDLILNEDLLLHADAVVLSPAIVPGEGNGELARLLKVPLNEDGFFLEAHVKLRPVDFATEGVFLAGMAHAPKSISESIAQASGAAARALTIISKDTFTTEATIAEVDEDLCSGCGVCLGICPYNAIETVIKMIDGKEKKVSHVVEAICKGCGSCAAACPSGAIDQKGFKRIQITSMIDAAVGQ